MTAQIHLQGIGLLPAKPASELVVGDILSWNYSPMCSEVVAIEPFGQQSLKIHEKSRRDGKVYIRLVRKSKLIAA
jgi:hypothetical protein